MLVTDAVATPTYRVVYRTRIVRVLLGCRNPRVRYSILFYSVLFHSIRFLFVCGITTYALSTSGANDHTNMTAPLPVCSAKLSMFGPG